MLIFTGLGALLVVVGLIVFLIRRRSAAKQASSLAWPSCQGQVTRAVVQSSRDKDDHVTYSAAIAYAYAVNGQSLSGDRVAWGGRSSSSNAREAEAMVARYPVGSAVQVYYNPERPGEAVLEPAAKGGLRTLMIVAVSFVVVGVIFIAIGPFLQD